MRRFAIVIMAAALAACGMVTSCTTTRQVAMTKEYQTQFMGFGEEYIVAACGEPTKTFPDGKGGKVMEYGDVAAFSKQSGIALSSQVDGGDFGVRPYAQFFIGKDGTCYSVRTNHTKAVTEYDNRKSWLVAGCSMGGTALAVSITGMILGIVGVRAGK